MRRCTPNRRSAPRWADQLSVPLHALPRAALHGRPECVFAPCRSSGASRHRCTRAAPALLAADCAHPPGSHRRTCPKRARFVGVLRAEGTNCCENDRDLRVSPAAEGPSGPPARTTTTRPKGPNEPTRPMRPAPATLPGRGAHALRRGAHPRNVDSASSAVAALPHCHGPRPGATPRYEHAPSGGPNRACRLCYAPARRHATRGERPEATERERGSACDPGNRGRERVLGLSPPARQRGGRPRRGRPGDGGARSRSPSGGARSPRAARSRSRCCP